MDRRLLNLRFLISTCFILVAFPLFANNSGSIPTMEPTFKYAFWALVLGGLSAISLPLGSLLGIVWKPHPKITAAFTAFGAGALLAALSIELIAPTVLNTIGQSAEQSGMVNNEFASSEIILSLIIGCVAGGLFFFLLNEILNSKGGYLRKASTTISYLNHLKHKKIRFILKNLSNSPLFINIPEDQIQNLVRYLREVSFVKDEIIAKQGEKGERMYIIETGEVVSVTGDKIVKSEGKGELIAETSLFLDIPYKASLIAATDVRAYELLKDDFDKIRDSSPHFNEIVKNLAEEEDKYLEMLIQRDSLFEEKSDDWTEEAMQELHHASSLPTTEEVNHAAESHSSAPLSIWLGILLDGIPESFVIGAGFLMLLGKEMLIGDPNFGDVIPYTLIAGLFLSNFPEAMSSSIGMKNIGWKTIRIFMLWFSLMVMTAIGSLLGYYFSASIPEILQIGVEGLAAGAMLTMIAQTMIPEAVHLGGHQVVGLSTLTGFLSAVAFKFFE